MTPSQIYWVLQLDSICAALVAASVIFAILGVISLFIACNDPDTGLSHAGCFVSFLVMTLCIVGSAFCPTTKVAAAMYVIPRVVNNEVIQADMLEVYKLGMTKVKEVLDAVPAPAPEKKK